MGFEVVPASVPASAADRRQVMTAPASALPSLTEIQQAEVKQFSLKEDEYRRMRVLLRMTVLDRQRRQGTRFGEYLETILRPYKDSVFLASVSRKGTPRGWQVSIHHDAKGLVEFQCPLEVIEAIAEGTATREELEGFHQDVLAELAQAGFLEVAG